MEFLIIIVRTPPNWRDYTLNYETMTQNPKHWTLFQRRVELWNKTFKTNYFEYRAKLKEIALYSFFETGIPVIEFENYGTLFDFLNENSHRHDLIILPTDDDDWYHPDIKDKIEPFFEDKELPYLQWKGWNYWSQSKEEIFELHSLKNSWTSSNEYAIRCSETNGHIKDHYEMKSNVYRYSEEPLSIWVRHLGSFWANAHGGFRFRSNCKRMPIPNELSWATEYVEMFREIEL